MAKDVEHLDKLLTQLTTLARNHGPRSEEVRKFVQNNAGDEPEFLELATTIIMMFEGKLDEKYAHVVKKLIG